MPKKVFFEAYSALTAVSSQLVCKKCKRAFARFISRRLVVRAALVTVKAVVSVISVDCHAGVGRGKSLYAIHGNITVFFTKVCHHWAFGLTRNF